MSGAACNPKIHLFQCTLQTCCVQQGLVQYLPDYGATVAYLAIFAVLLGIQLALGLWKRTWLFAVGMVCGFVLEVLGYAGRLMIRKNPFKLGNFLLYLIPLGLGPAFMTASIYLMLGRLIVVYGRDYARFAPRTYSIVFVTSDVFALTIQAVGGGLSASAGENDSLRSRAVDVLVSGLVIQAFSLLVFLGLCVEFGTRVRRAGRDDRAAGKKPGYNPAFLTLRQRKTFTGFLWALTTASVAIFIRCVYRAVELGQGFSGTIANEQIPFLILEGPLIMLAGVLLSVYHPGLVFRGGFWQSSSLRREWQQHDAAVLRGEGPKQQGRAPSDDGGPATRVEREVEVVEGKTLGADETGVR